MNKFSFSFWRALAAGALIASPVMAQPALAQAILHWQQSPIIFLPSAIAAGEGTMAEGQVLVTFPLRWVSSTRLVQDVSLRHGEETIVLAAQSLLPKVQVSVPDGARRAGFCTRSRVAEHREGVGFMGLMFGNMLNGLQDMQTCLEDTNKDGLFDRAFVLGDGDAIVELGAIDPVPFEELLAEPLGNDDDVARITLARVGRRQIELQFDIIQRGHVRNFRDMRSGRFTASRLNSYRYADNGTVGFSLLGVRFDMTSYDREANSAVLRWAPRVSAQDFVAIPDNVAAQYTW